MSYLFPVSASEMTCIVSSGALNSTQSLTYFLLERRACIDLWRTVLYSLTEIETETEMDIFSLSKTEMETKMFCKTETK